MDIEEWIEIAKRLKQVGKHPEQVITGAVVVIIVIYLFLVVLPRLLLGK